MTYKTFDIETLTTNNTLVPYCISYITQNDKKIFFGMNCIEEFISFVENEKDTENSYIFSHNLSFDGSIILQYAQNINEISGVFFKGNIYSLEIKRQKTKINFKCSLRFFPFALEKASSLLNTQNKKNFNHSLINIDNYKNHKTEIIEYCLNDSIVLMEIISKYNNIIKPFFPDWLKNTNSISSLSLNIFTKLFNNMQIETTSLIEHDNFFRQGYYGGRCEIFGNKKINEKLYHFDFTGMYAQVMLQEYCYGEWQIVKNPEKIENDGFYYIDGFSQNFIPILPHHSKDNKLIFSNGYVSGLYWYEEIKLFLENNGIIEKIYYKICYKKKGKIFKNFIKKFTEIRKKNIESNTIGKLIINSLYGRLGMEEKKTETKIFNKEKYQIFRKKNEKSIIKENNIGDLYIVEHYKKKKDEYLNSNVALAAIITSKARIKLYKGITDVIKNGGRVLYTDTDSIFASFEKNVDNKTFGEIFFDTSKKDTKIKSALFALPKAYILEYENKKTICKIKGIKTDSLDFKEFESMFHNNTEKKINTTILKKANFIIKQENMYKIINFNRYEKRIFTKNKTETIPLFRTKEEEYTSNNIILEKSFIINDTKFIENLKKNKIIKFNEKILIKYQKVIEDPLTDYKIINNVEITIHDDFIILYLNKEIIFNSIEIIYYAFKNNIISKHYDFSSRSKIFEVLWNMEASILDIVLNGKNCKKKFNNINILSKTITNEQNT